MSIVDTLAAYLVHEDQDIRSIAVEGFAKLLLASILQIFEQASFLIDIDYKDIVSSPKVLSNLVLLFFNPTTEEDIHLRQCLSVFFPAFAFGNFAAHSLVVEQAFVPTLRTVSKEKKYI
jgi:condensin complex subunit 3